MTRCEVVWPVFKAGLISDRCLSRKAVTPFGATAFSIGAEDGAQTRDPQLGRLMLYQLSYFRIIVAFQGSPPMHCQASLSRLCGQRWIRTTEGVSQQIYSLPHLATLVFARFVREPPARPLRASLFLWWGGLREGGTCPLRFLKGYGKVTTNFRNSKCISPFLLR